MHQSGSGEDLFQGLFHDHCSAVQCYAMQTQRLWAPLPATCWQRRHKHTRARARVRASAEVHLGQRAEHGALVHAVRVAQRAVLVQDLDRHDGLAVLGQKDLQQGGARSQVTTGLQVFVSGWVGGDGVGGWADVVCECMSMVQVWG